MDLLAVLATPIPVKILNSALPVHVLNSALPVHVLNTPAPDKIADETLKVAQETLRWAQYTFWLSAAVGLVGVFGGIFAVLDYLLSRDLATRKPKLSFRFNGNAGDSFEAQARLNPGTKRYEFPFKATTFNVGKANARQLIFILWIPETAAEAVAFAIATAPLIGIRHGFTGFRTEVAVAHFDVPQDVFSASFSVPGLPADFTFEFEVMYEGGGGTQTGKRTITIVA
jgi:hypothetical protein